MEKKALAEIALRGSLNDLSSTKLNKDIEGIDDEDDSDVTIKQNLHFHNYQPNSTKASHIIFFDQTFVDNVFTSETNTIEEGACWLKSDLRLLGCGYDGQAFVATMICQRNAPIENDNKLTTSNDSSLYTKHVILKVKTAHNPRNPDYANHGYVSETDSDIDQMKITYQTLNGNDTTPLMRKHFILPFGMVHIPRHMLYEAIRAKTNDNNDANDNEALILELPCNAILPESSSLMKPSPSGATQPIEHAIATESPILATVMEAAPGKSLDLKYVTHIHSKHHRHKVVKDLICMYQHMYERNFIHQDIKFKHIYYADDGDDDDNDTQQSTSTTTSLIDYNRIDMILNHNHKKYKIKDRLQQVQVMQLLILVSNICIQDHRHFEVPNYVTTKILKDLATTQNFKKWIKSMKQCEFQDSYLDSLYATMTEKKVIIPQQVYQHLSNWVGGCSTTIWVQ